MKFDTIRLVGSSGSPSVNLVMPAPGVSAPFLVKAVDGLGPPEGEVVNSDNAQGPSYFQQRRFPNREVVVRVGLYPNWLTTERPDDLRNQLYALLEPGWGSTIQIQLRLGGGVVVYSTGVVKRIEPNHFSKDPEVQITIDCADAAWLGPTVVDLITTGGSATSPNILNPGSVRTGFIMQYQLSGAVTSFYLQEYNNSSNRLQLSSLSGMQAADIIEFNTNFGSLRARYQRAGVWSNLNSNITSESQWVQAPPGLSRVTVSTTGSFVSFTTQPKYWGI